MQGREHGRLDFCRALPEAAGHVMDQIECFALPCTPVDQLQHSFLMFTKAAFEIVAGGAGMASAEELTGHARSLRCGDRCADPPVSHLPLQSPQNLLRAARALWRDG